MTKSFPASDARDLYVGNGARMPLNNKAQGRLLSIYA
jgi:hypothetical protein